MFCEHCGSRVSATANFCNRCRKPVTGNAKQDRGFAGDIDDASLGLQEQQIDELMSKNPNDLMSSSPEGFDTLTAVGAVNAKKGFVGYWWNVAHAGQLDKRSRKKLVRRTVAVLLVLAIIAASAFLVINAPWASEDVEEDGVYTSFINFVRNWNATTRTNPSGVTNGQAITSPDISYYGIEMLKVDDGVYLSLYVSGDYTRRSIRKIEYISSNFMATDYEEAIGDLLAIIPHRITERRVGEVISTFRVRAAAIDSEQVTGFEIIFFNSEEESDEIFKVNPRQFYDVRDIMIIPEPEPEPEPGEDGYEVDDEAAREAARLDQIALEVIRGEWGDGQERRDRLSAAGHDWVTIQTRVNAMLRQLRQQRW